MTTTRRRVIATGLLCAFTLQTVVGHAAASDLAATGATGNGAFRVPAGGDVVTTERDFDPQRRVVRDALQVGGTPELQVTSNSAAAATGWERTVAYPTNAVWTRSNDQIGRLVGLAGMTAPLMEELLARLAKAGYACGSSGTFDDEVAAAAKAFQKANRTRSTPSSARSGLLGVLHRIVRQRQKDLFEPATGRAEL